MFAKLRLLFHPYRIMTDIVQTSLFTLIKKEDIFNRHIDREARSEARRMELIRQAMSSQSMGVSDRNYVPGHEVVVSLTTHGSRIYDVFQSVESIMQGTYKPNRIVLWLSASEFADCQLPESLKMQQKRGLDIRYIDDLGPHTKLIPALQQFPDDVIITIDDDIYYAYDMVENLVKAYLQEPQAIHANRVAIMTFDDRHQLKPYFHWLHYQHPDKQTVNNFIIGSEGCLYPPHSLSVDVFDVPVFRSICPYADDVWFTAMAIRKHTPIHHLYTHYDQGCAGSIENFPLQSSGLIAINEVDEGALNNRQIHDVFTKYGILDILRSYQP